MIRSLAPEVARFGRVVPEVLQLAGLAAAHRDQLVALSPQHGRISGRFSVATWQEYQAQFAQCNGEIAIGEASPLYLYSPKAPEQIQRHVPEAKLIAILRNPIDRAYSAFLHLVRDHREEVTDFAEALRREKARIRDRWEHIWHYQCMGFYYEQLKRYYERIELQRVFRDDILRLQELAGLDLSQ